MKISFIVLATSVFSLIYIILNVEYFLEYESLVLPESPDAVIILGGGNGNRIKEGVIYFNQSNPDYMIMTAGYILNTSVAKLMKEYAVDLGINPEKILIEEKSLSTKDHPIYLDSILKENQLKEIVIVTSKFHSNRSYDTFKYYFKDQKHIKIYMIAAPDNIDYSRWYLDHESSEKIGIELLKTIVYKLIFLFN